VIKVMFIFFLMFFLCSQASSTTCMSLTDGGNTSSVRLSTLEHYDFRFRTHDFQSLLHRRPKHPLSVLVPPVDLQFGGRELLNSITPVSKQKYGSKGLIFVNQKLNLDQLGPGAAVPFVVDTNGNLAFAFSHGRDSENLTSGGLFDLSFDGAQGESRYPWPRDFRNHYLPEAVLFQARGVHWTLAEGLAAETGSPSALNFARGGAIVVSHDGKPQVVYLSGQLNQGGQQTADDVELQNINFRALPVSNRKHVHDSLANYVFGRGVIEVLNSAPEDLSGVLEKIAVTVFPNRVAFPDESLQVREPRDFMLNYFGSEGVLEFVSIGYEALWHPILDDYFNGLTEKEKTSAEHRQIATNMYHTLSRKMENDFYYEPENILKVIEFFFSKKWAHEHIKSLENDNLFFKIFLYSHYPDADITVQSVKHVFSKREILDLDPIILNAVLFMLLRQQDVYTSGEKNRIADALKIHLLSEDWFQLKEYQGLKLSVEQVINELTD